MKHILVRTEEAARRSMEQQGRAMAEAARVAFAEELGPTLERLRSAMLPLTQRQRQWEQWLTHAAAAASGSAVTWVLAAFL